MKRIAAMGLAAVSFAAVSMAASWTGWVSDAKCGAKGSSAAHAECARSCIKAGEKPVLVTDDGKVLQFANPQKVVKQAGNRVVVTGTEKDGAIEVASVKAAK